MRPTNHFGNIRCLEPVAPFANHHNYGSGEDEEAQNKEEPEEPLGCKASRTELSQLLTDKLPDTLSEFQRFDKITNLLSSLRKTGIIRVGEKRMWFLVKSPY